MKVSILILTYNEENNLPRCLTAIDWCDDIIVVDSGSTDTTVEIAQRAGARVVYRAFDNFANQRNFGLSEGKPHHEWVLHLDADEVPTLEFRKSLEVLQPKGGIDAYRVPSKIILYDHWLRYAGMYPAYQVRLGHRERLRFRQVGHGQRETLPQSCVDTFDEPYLHYNFSQGLGAWLRRHVKYAEDEAHLLVSLRGSKRSSQNTVDGGDDGTGRRRKLKEMSARLPLLLRPIARFCYVLVWRRGILDGRYGILYAFMLSVYEGMVAILAADELIRKKAGRLNDQAHARGSDKKAVISDRYPEH